MSAQTNAIPRCDSPQRWTKDDKVKKCQSCGTEFSFLTRKHHCRACGQIFCSSCTGEQLLVKGFNGLQRCCFSCYVSFSELSPQEQQNVDIIAKKYKDTVRIAKLLIKREANTREKGILVIGDSLLFGVQRNENPKLFIKKRHLIDLASIKAKGNLLKLEFGYLTNDSQPILLETPHSPEIIRAIREAHRGLTIGSPMNIQLDVPETKLLDLQPDSATQPIAGGFELHYKALSTFYNRLPSQDLLEFIKGLFMENNTEIDFQHCPGTETESSLSFELRPVFQSLQFNNYFRSIIFDRVNRKGVIEELALMFQKNTHITRLALSNIVKDSSQLVKLGNSLKMNSSSGLVDLMIENVDLSPALNSLTSAFASMSRGFRIISFVNCKLKTKQISSFIQNGLMKNYGLSLTLEELNLSKNSFEQEGSEAIQKFFLKIGNFSPMKRILLSQCSLNLVLVLRPIYYFKDLRELDISYSKFGPAAVQSLCPILEQSKSLKTLGLSGCGLNEELFSVVNATLNALNEDSLHSLKLVLSDNPLNEKSINAFMGVINHGSLFHTIDLSNCKLKESGFLALCSSLCRLDATLDTLILNQAKLESLNQTQGNIIATNLINLLQKQDSIRTLSLSGGYSDSILISFFRKLHDNQSLLELDVSNNKLGDIGASAIASLIRNNSFIASIHCDNNSFNQSGFQAIALSISRSKSLQYFDCQWQDLKNSKGRHRLIRKAIIDIQITLAINRSQYVHPRFESSNSEILPICTRPIPSSTIPPELLEEDELESKPENDTPVFPVDMPQGDTRVISPIHNTHTVPVIAPQAYTSTIPEFGEQGPSFAYTAG